MRFLCQNASNIMGMLWQKDIPGTCHKDMCQKKLGPKMGAKIILVQITRKRGQMAIGGPG